MSRPPKNASPGPRYIDIALAKAKEGGFFAEEPEEAIEKLAATPKVSYGIGTKPKGLPKTGGRKPGSPNIKAKNAKEAFSAAFKKMGGVPALTVWGKRFPSEFYKLYGKQIPQEKEVSGPGGEPIKTDVKIEFV